MQDKESWFEAIKGSDQIKQSGAWFTLVYADGTEERFQASKWTAKLENEKFLARVEELMDIEVVRKFDSREGSADAFYGDTGE